MASFSYYIHLASSKPDETEDRGSATAEEIISAFRTFGWSSQLAEANRRRILFPSFGIRNIGNRREVLLSAYGEPSNVKFVGQYIFETDEPRILAFIRKSTVASADTDEQSLDSALQIVQLFLNEDHPGLLRAFNSRASVGIFNRIGQILIGMPAFFLGGLATLTSGTILVSMLTEQESETDILFFVGLVGLAVAPPVFVAGIRLILGKPNKFGGLFSPNTLRMLAIAYGLIGLAGLFIAIKQRDVTAIAGLVSFMITTQGAFVLAGNREAA